MRTVVRICNNLLRMCTTVRICNTCYVYTRITYIRAFIIYKRHVPAGHLHTGYLQTYSEKESKNNEQPSRKIDKS